jgi:hypothetical protein
VVFLCYSIGAMRRIPVILTLLAFGWWLVPTPSPKYHAQQPPHGNAAQSSKAEEMNPRNPAVIKQTVSNCQPCTEQNGYKKAESAGQPHDLVELINAASTTVIALFTVIAAIIFYFQLKTTRNSERAWLMAELEWADDRPGKFGWGNGGSVQGATTWARLSLNCSNDGKTPAWIVQKRVRMEIVETVPPKPQFPPANLEWEFEASEPEPLAPGKRNHPVSFDITCQGKWNFEVETMTDRELIVYGFIKYRDMFQVERETRFGYRFAKSSKAELERIKGFPEYNKHT